MNGLKPNTTYYVRPFATNGNGTAYGDAFVVTTKLVTYKIKVYLAK
ncbi:NDNF family FN3 domain-containing protein [Spirosoma validum]|uniref:Fibronectin type III domain-containing protein n=1 Tax=Spirosoma validum TaxID=2771355 RepID=A0A927B4P5_9BACT|nr:hypothetical protein [Spirosoma validum]MBD2755370.1 hypothetical protein [Spirosoma validum]